MPTRNGMMTTIVKMKINGTVNKRNHLSLFRFGTPTPSFRRMIKTRLRNSGHAKRRAQIHFYLIYWAPFHASSMPAMNSSPVMSSEKNCCASGVKSFGTIFAG